MTRRLIYPTKKLRGAARRIRAIQRWRNEVKGYFPPNDELTRHYWNWKIPVDLNFVEGPWTTHEIQRICAQSLIDSCYELIQAKPESAPECRITCVICIPNMFTSELCIYLSEDYFNSKVMPASNQYGKHDFVKNRSLSQEWGLVLPPGFGEIGIELDYHDEESEWELKGEHWYFGQVHKNG